MCTAVTPNSYASGCSTTVNIPTGTATTSYVLSNSLIPSTSATFSYHGWYGYHAPRCVNCGYCFCCQRAGVREEDGPVPGDGRDS